MNQPPASTSAPHPAMLTAQDDRDAVLKGLGSRAAGCITKPFEVDVLMKPVHAVLGLPAKP